jgi:hypothetical protein
MQTDEESDMAKPASEFLQISLRLAKNGLFFPLPIEAENCYDPFQLPNR